MTCDLEAQARALAARVERTAPALGTTRLVLIDGPGGAGKTTLAGHLARALGGEASRGPGTYQPGLTVPADAHVQTLHADDMYGGWEGLPLLSDVLVDQVIAPLAVGDSGAFRMWDWHRSERTTRIAVPPGPVLIVEGVGVGMASARVHASVVVWIEAPPDVCLQRGLERDGEGLRAEWLQWQRREMQEFDREGTRAAADVVLSSAPV